MARLSELQGSCSWDGPIPIHESMRWMELQFEYLTKCTEYLCFSSAMKENTLLYDWWCFQKVRQFILLGGDISIMAEKLALKQRSNSGIASEESQVQEPELNKWSPKYGSAAQTSFRVLFEDTFTKIRQDHFLLNATDLFWPQIFLTISSYLTWIPESNTLTTTTRRVWLWRYSRDQNFSGHVVNPMP